MPLKDTKGHDWENTGENKPKSVTDAKVMVTSVSNSEDVSHYNGKELRECCLDSVEIVRVRGAG